MCDKDRVVFLCFYKYTRCSSGMFTFIFMQCQGQKVEIYCQVLRFTLSAVFQHMALQKKLIFGIDMRTQFGLAKQIKGANRQMGHRKSGYLGFFPEAPAAIRYPVSPAKSRRAPQ